MLEYVRMQNTRFCLDTPEGREKGHVSIYLNEEGDTVHCESTLKNFDYLTSSYITAPYLYANTPFNGNISEKVLEDGS